MRKQGEFPYLEEYKKLFPVDDKTIFAYKNEIYADYPLPPEIEAHERVHLKQQIDPDRWVERYLREPEFRLKEELEAFKVQVNYFKDRNERMRERIKCAGVISSELYGGMISFDEAFKLLK